MDNCSETERLRCRSQWLNTTKASSSSEISWCQRTGQCEELDFAAWQTIVHYLGKDLSLRSERSFSIALQCWEPCFNLTRTPLCPLENTASTPQEHCFVPLGTLLWYHKNIARHQRPWNRDSLFSRFSFGQRQDSTEENLVQRIFTLGWWWEETAILCMWFEARE